MSIVTVHKNTYKVEHLYQWDVDQQLEVYGLSLASIPEVHFTNVAMGRAIVRQATMDAAGVIRVDIPNSLLQKPYTIIAYICTYTGGTFETQYKIDIPIKERKQPEDYTLVDDEELYSFRALERQLNDMEGQVDNLIATKTVVVNNLTTGGTAAALSAEMGKVLNEDKLSKSGGTMEPGAKINFKATNGTGLGFKSVPEGSNITAFDVADDESSNRNVLRFYPPSFRSQAEALRLAEVKDGKTTWSTILHTGNKPSGSYTGNASARSISIGGVGNVLCVTSANGTFLVTPAGGAVFNHVAGEYTANDKTQINFTNGVLTIAETATMCNTNGTTYTYQVL